LEGLVKRTSLTILLCFCLAALLTLTGCGEAGEDESSYVWDPATSTFTGTVESSETYYAPSGKLGVTVTLADGHITDISGTGPNMSSTYGPLAVNGLKSKIITAQSFDIADVVSGATGSCEALKKAGKDALKKVTN
jgi:uncharacterized protein with FMN-binding domain